MRALVRFSFICLAVMLFGNASANSAEAEPQFDTKTKVRLVKNGLWLEAEISPRALLEAVPSCDRNANGRLEEGELSQSRAEILSYFAANVALAVNGKTLRTDSTYFAFRSPATPAAVPDRFYIYHWYAMLRPPEHLRVTNTLFHEWQNTSRHQGSVVSGDRILKFDFNGEATAPSVNKNTVEFSIAVNGEVALLAPDDHTLQASYFWIGLGLFGLIFFRLASAARNKWGRELQDKEEDEEEEEITLTGNAVLHHASVLRNPV